MNGGIQQSQELAQPNQLLEASNVWWTDNGAFQQRPGLLFENNICLAKDMSLYSWYGETADDYPVWVFEETDGTFTQVTMPSASFAGQSYREKNTIVYPQLTPEAGKPVIMVDWTDSNTSGTRLDWEYFNGTEWVPLAVNQYAHQRFLNASTWGQSGYYRLQLPENATNTTVDGLQRMVRFTLRDADIDNATTMPGTMDGWLQVEDYSPYPLGLLTFQFLYQTMFVSVIAQNGASYDPNIIYTNTYTGGIQTLPTYTSEVYVTTPSPQPTSNAVTLKGYNIGFFTFGNNILQLDGQTGIVTPAAVETRDFVVGRVGGFNSIYNPTNVPQRGAPPQAKFIAWYQNQLFAFNTPEAPNIFWWSAPSSALAPGYAVWPSISYDLVDDKDNSPITGVILYQEQLIVFKRNSIWKIVYNGQISSGTAPLNSYIAVSATSGIGCAAPNSIVVTPVGVFFLAEDGAYVFNGSATTKVSGPIDLLLKEAQSSLYPWAFAANSMENHCVYLAINRNNVDTGREYDDPSTTFPTNDTLLVFDYKNNAWWLWDGFSPVLLTTTKDTADREVTYIANSSGSCFSFGGNTDNGDAITAEVLTQRQYGGNIETKTFREMEVIGSNEQLSCDVAITVSDYNQDVTMYPLSFEDDYEAHVGTAIVGTSTAAATVRRQRRLMFREAGTWAQAKISHSNLAEPFQMSVIKLGFIQNGDR